MKMIKMTNNYDFTNANINVVYSEISEKYLFEISFSDFWNSITNEEYKQYIKESIRENTVEGLNMYFHTRYNDILINAVIEDLGFEGTSTECYFEIVEDKEEETMTDYYSEDFITDNEKLEEMGLGVPTPEELGMTLEEYYGPNPYIIHPNERYTDTEDDALFGLTPETICLISEVDIDVFESHQNYNSALHVAKQIAKEINQCIQEAHFSGENSIAEDLRYDYDTNGTYCQMYEFEGTYSKITGEMILDRFDIHDDSYFEN